MKKSLHTLIVVLAILSVHNAFGQAGMTVSPGKMYFTLPAGGSATQKIIVSNPNNAELEVGVSTNDWNYDKVGNNITYDAGTLPTSAAAWIQVMPGSYFTLQPGEKRELDVIFSVPSDANQEVPVHTAMLFLTQLNLGDGRAENGTSIKVSVRMGVKIYHSFTQVEERNVEVANFTDILPEAGDKNTSGFLELELNNTGKMWIEGRVRWEVLNTATGDKKKLEDQDVYLLPGDNRFLRQSLPANLPKGKYTASAVVNYGDKDELKLVELEFER